MSERVLWHLTESKVPRDDVTVCKKEAKGRSHTVEITNMPTIDRSSEMLEVDGEDRSWLSRRFGENARAFVMDTEQKEGGIVGSGRPMKTAFSLVKVP